MPIEIPISVPDKILRGLLASAFEGGSNYWYMTRTHFIALLTTRWPDAPILIQRIGLVRTCRAYAEDAFLHQYTGPEIDALRIQLLAVVEDGVGWQFDPE